MKQIILIGAILSTFMLVVGGFSSAAIAKAIESTSIPYTLRDKINDNEWWPGQSIAVLLLFLLILIDAMKSGQLML